MVDDAPDGYWVQITGNRVDGFGFVVRHGKNLFYERRTQRHHTVGAARRAARRALKRQLKRDRTQVHEIVRSDLVNREG